MEPIHIAYPFRPVRRSLATGRVADLFGLADEGPPHVVADNVQLDIRPGDLVFLTGPSGSGKSSLLRAAGRQLRALDTGSLGLPDLPLVDCFQGPVEAALERLAACGLAEARVLLRTPDELSDGQRYRFRLAYALDRCLREAAEGAVPFLAADEFAANLDRTLARVLAVNLRKLCTRTGVGLLLATTHEDMLDDLNPDLVVRCRGEGEVVCTRPGVKKKSSPSETTFGSRPAPSPTGRTSLGGITGVTTSPSSGGWCCSGTVPFPLGSASSAPRPRR